MQTNSAQISETQLHDQVFAKGCLCQVRHESVEISNGALRFKNTLIVLKRTFGLCAFCARQVTLCITFFVLCTEQLF